MANLVEIYHVADGGQGLRPRQTSKNPVGTSLRNKYSKLYFWRSDLITTSKQTEGIFLDCGVYNTAKNGPTLFNWCRMERKGLVGKGRHRANCCTKLDSLMLPILFGNSYSSYFSHFLANWIVWSNIDGILPVTLIVLDYCKSHLSVSF